MADEIDKEEVVDTENEEILVDNLEKHVECLYIN
jgi:hypothetical protein